MNARRTISWFSCVGLIFIAVLGLVDARTPDEEFNVSASSDRQERPQVAVDRLDDDRLVVVGEDDASDSGASSWYSTDGGSSFSSSELPLTFDGHTFDAAREPSIAVDRDGTWYAAYVVFDDDGSGNPVDASVVVARSEDGLTWQESGILEDNRGAGATPAAFTPHLAIDLSPLDCSSSSDDIRVAWVRKTSGNSAIWTSESGDGGATWSGPVEISDGSSGAEVVVRPRVAFGLDGVHYVAWLDDVKKTIEVEATSGNGNAVDVTAASVSLGCGGGDCGVDLGCPGGALHASTPEVVVDDSWGPARGTVYLAFTDETSPADGLDVYRISSTDQGATWTPPTRINGDPTHAQYGVSLAVHPIDGELHASWYDRRDDAVNPTCRETLVYHAAAEEGVTFTDETAVPGQPSLYDASSPGGGHVALAAGSETVFPVWIDARSGEEEVYLASIGAHRGTQVGGGTLDADTTWEAANSPFLVLGDLTVDTETTLTVEAGAEVRFATCDDLRAGMRVSKVELTVEGILNANGESSSSISFDSATSPGERGDWFALRFLDTSDSSTLRHVWIRNSVDGVRLSDASPVLEDVTISEVSGRGVRGRARSGQPFSPTRVTIERFGVEGVDVTDVSGTWTDVVVRDGDGGAGDVEADASDLRLVAPSVTDNSGPGLRVSTSGGGLEVILGTFARNEGIGLQVEGQGARSIVANDIEGNAGSELVVDNSSSSWPNVAAYANNLDSAGSGYAIEMVSGSLSVDARGNHWGDAASELGSYPVNVSKIFDIHDDSSLRHVDFRLDEAAPVGNDADLVTYLQLPANTSSRDVPIYGGAVARGGIDRVEISIDDGPWESATVEGAAFRRAWTPDAGTHTVRSRVCDTSGCGPEDTATVEITSATGPTTSGRLQGDETWTSTPGSPIVLEGDVIVPTDTTLTIAAGTEVRAHFLSDSRHDGLDPSRIELIVEGTLLVDGDSGSPATLDSSRASAPEKGDWYGVRFTDSASDVDSRIEFAELAHGVNGIKLESAAPDIVDSSSGFNSESGLTGDSGGLSKALWSLNRNTFSDNDGAGVDVDGDTEVEMLSVVAANNGTVGVRIEAYPNVVTVTGATLKGNGSRGLEIDSGGSGLTLLDSDVSENGDEGIFVDHGGTNIRLERLTIQNNGDVGLRVSRGTELVLLKSTITGNRRGLDIDSPRLVGAYNTITGNTGQDLDSGAGIHYAAQSGAPAVLGMSDIDNDGSGEGGEVEISGARALSARRNWWGPDTTADMDAASYPADLFQIHDIEDNPARGRLDYDNWAAASVAGRGSGERASHITWPSEGQSLNAHGVVVRGVAYAAGGIDRVEICVRETSELDCDDPSPEAPSWGVADGFEAWSFTWFPEVSGTYELKTRVIDDAQQASTPDETVSLTIDRSAPTSTWTGPVTEDSTWGGPGSEIVLTGDVVVQQDVTLTVLEGTTLRAQARSDDRLSGEDPSRVELIARGNLALEGLPGTGILATSTTVPVERRDWYGVRFEESSDPAGNAMRHATIEGGWFGVEFERSYATIEGLSVTNNHSHGILVSDTNGPFPTDAAIEASDVTFNGGHGLYTTDDVSTWTITGSSFSDNDRSGVWMVNCDASGLVSADGTSFDRNGEYGLYMSSCIADLEIARSTIDGNESSGLHNRYGSTTVRATTVANHTSGDGLRLEKSDASLISKSTFSDNRRNVEVTSDSELKLVFNDLGAWTDEGYENVRLGNTTLSIFHHNNLREFPGQTSEIIFANRAAGGVNAGVNYWDPATTSEMNANPFPSDISSIEDVEEDAQWGRVDWSDHLASPVDISPPQVCGFASPVDGDAITGTTFQVKGAAAADAGVQQVDVAIDDTSNWMPASGTNLWEYEWTPPSSGTYTLYCRTTDLESGVQPTPASITVDVNAADVTTSGPLSGDETWSGVLTLTGDVTVPSGVTLTIEEDTMIRSVPLSDDQFAGADASKIELIVEGRLDLQGSEVSPVTFTADRVSPDEPQPGDWYGIRFTDDAEPVAVEHAVIEAGVTGITSSSGSHQDVRHCTIRDMSDDGIDMEWGDGDRDASSDEGVDITDNVIEDVGFYGLRAQGQCRGSSDPWEGSTIRLERNEIRRTDRGEAIYLYRGQGALLSVSANVVEDAAQSSAEAVHLRGCSNESRGFEAVEVAENTITNSGSNLSLRVRGFRRGDAVSIRDNVISGGKNGLDVYECRGVVERNELSGGDGYGIRLYNDYDAGRRVLARNTITDYTGDGIYLDRSESPPVLLYNRIENAGDDAIVCQAYHEPRIHWNNIAGSGGYDLRMRFSHAQSADARRNHWAGTNAELGSYPDPVSEIYDVLDEASLGRVDYRHHEELEIDTAVTLESRFVWPADGTTLSGRTITLEGTAYAEAGIAEVQVSTDGGATWQPAEGTDVWSFSYTPDLPAGGTELVTFQSRVVPQTGSPEASPDQTSVTFDDTLLTTEGTLPGDETWSGTVHLTGDVIVGAGDTLTIEPGATVRSQVLADNEAGGDDPKRIELIVEGRLELQGTGIAPATLTSARSLPDEPQPGDWYGIRFTDDAEPVAVEHAVIEAGVTGITSSSGSHQDVRHCTIRDMSDDGIDMEWGDGDRDASSDEGVDITDNVIEDVGFYGLRAQGQCRGSSDPWEGSTIRLERNEIRRTDRRSIDLNNGQGALLSVSANVVENAAQSGQAVYLRGCQSESRGFEAVEVAGNTIANSGSSLSLDVRWFRRGDAVSIRDNVISGGKNGLYMYECRGVVERNELSGGDGYGIRLYNRYEAGRRVLARNTITDYTGDGIYLDRSDSPPVLLYNRIENAGDDAIHCQAYHEPRIHWNNIAGSGGYDLRMRLNYAQSADARRNHWAGTNAELGSYPDPVSEIYDVLDEASLGRVDYRNHEDLEIDTAVTLESRFVWPADGTTLSGRTITLEGTAYAEAGIAEVQVSTDGGATWQPAEGTDVWSFSYTPDLPAGGTELVTFQSRVVPQTGSPEASPDQTSVTFDDTLLTTEGTLPGDETWSGTVHLTGDVIVPPGVTLTIAPATTVSSQPFADDRHGGNDMKRIELIVQGALDLRGPSQESISLTSSSSTPAKGHWYGIVFDTGARDLLDLRGFTIEWAYRALSNEDGSGMPNVRDARIRQIAEHGVEASGVPLPDGSWFFEGVEISFIDGAGVRFETEGGGSPLIEIKDLVLTDFGRDGLYLTVRGDGRASIADSQIESTNNYAGIEVTQASRLDIRSVKVTKLGVGGYAVQTSNTDHVDIADSELVGGSHTIYARIPLSLTVRSSRITDGDTGVYVTGSSYGEQDVVIEANRISDTADAGIHIGSRVDRTTVFHNDIFNSAGYALQNDSAEPVDASQNYWGESMVSEMMSKGCDANIDKILDKKDGSSRGLVTYCPFAENPFGDQPTIYLEFVGSTVEIRWRVKGDLTYDLIRGDVANLAASGEGTDLGDVSCDEQANGSGTIVDESADPPAGQSWFFLLRDHETPGTYGFGSDGGERTPASGDCPLDSP